MSELCIFDAIRTPRGLGKPGGALARLAPQDLTGQLLDALRIRLGDGLDPALASLTLGCVGQVAAQGGHIALVSRMAAGLPERCRALSINNYCVSGLSAIALAAMDAMARADDRLRLAGGVEMMSRVPFTADKGALYSDEAVSEALGYVPVFLAADLLATLNGIDRKALDDITLRSHQRAAAAAATQRTELIDIRDDHGAVLLDRDESVRPGLSEAALARFEPAFAEAGKGVFDGRLLAAAPHLDAIEHVHTVAHCPPVADGAALAVIGSRAAGSAAGLAPRARILSVEEASASPTVQLTAGFAAMEQALAATGLTLEDFDQIEFMEAFAATPVKFERDYSPDPARVNPDGGHLAMGHPMGATGAILLANLLGGLERRGGQLGLAVAHGGSGVGAAIIIERI